MTAAARWREFAACAQVGPDLFFSDDPDDVAQAKRVCGGCEVFDTCTVDALANTTTHGVQAAMTAAERLDHPDHRRVRPLASFLPETDERAAQRWQAEQNRLARRAAAEAARRAENFEDLIHPFDRKVGR